jgi:hypothetical protein
MTNIPIKQRLQVDPVERIEWKIAQGIAVSGDELLQVIDRLEAYPLDDRTRDLLRKFSISAVKRRGRPHNCRGREDFALEELDDRYPALLLKYQGEFRQKRCSAAAEGTVLPVSERTPSELAYSEILQEMQADFSNIDWLALRTKHSQWKKGRFHSSENHTDSQDFDAEIERQFPTPKSS